VTEPIKTWTSRELFIWIELLLFRNIGNRILLGGGRNLNFDERIEFAQTEIVQNKLEQLLKEVILPNQDFKVAQPMERYNGNRGTRTRLFLSYPENVLRREIGRNGSHRKFIVKQN
jgi:hypothetical protein